MNDQKTKTLTVRVCGPYGRVVIRPECETSKLFAQLLGQTTLTEQNIKFIKLLGYEIKTKTLEGVEL